MIYASLDFERELWISGYNLVCGIDEVGRGCFAGPVVAGAVIFSPNCKVPKGVADSKLLKPKQRDELSEEIKNCATAWAVGEISVSEINQFGIGLATQMAFSKALHTLVTQPDFVLIDAFYMKGFDRQIQKPVKNGDKLCLSIAAASIIAKVYRDELMKKLDLVYPDYEFGKHKGYGTKRHREAIKENGLCDLHRTSFNLEKFL